MIKRIPHAAILFLVAIIYLLGGFDFAERRLIDLRFQMFGGSASGSLIIVEIDPDSLREIGVWPWPRRLHAKLLDNLLEAGVKRIGMTIDFSSVSNEQDDTILERAFSSAYGRVVLPTFTQEKSVQSVARGLVTRVPLPRFRRHVGLASVNVFPETDGLVRRISHQANWNADTVLTMPTVLSGADSWGEATLAIDYGIDPTTIPRLSYSDVLHGRFEPGLVAGRTVLVGASALELGDWLAVPVYHALPGVMVQALAYETIIQGRGLKTVSEWAILLVAALIALLMGPKLAVWSWRQGGGFLILGIIFVIGVSCITHASLAITLDILPWIIVGVLSYGYGLSFQIDHQSMRVFIKTMAESHGKLIIHNLAENTTDGLVVVRYDGTINFSNPSADKLFGYAPGELAGQPIGELFPDCGIRFDGEEVTVILNQGPREILGRIKGESVASLSVEIVTATVELGSGVSRFERRDGPRHAVVFTIRDIRVRKAAEWELVKAKNDAEAANLAKSVFLANMSHELRTPLNAIIGFSQAMKSTIFGPLGHHKYDEYASDIDGAGRHLLKFIDDLLDVAKVESGRLTMTEQRVDLKELVENSIRVIDTSFSKHAYQIDMNIEPDLPNLLADPRRIRQVIINLVTNAIRHGGVAVDINVGAYVTEDGSITISVSDDGKGIAPEFQTEVFAPFVQVDVTNASVYSEGSGLGLALVKILMELHGGDVRLESQLGFGTTFFARFPPNRVFRPHVIENESHAIGTESGKHDATGR